MTLVNSGIDQTRLDPSLPDPSLPDGPSAAVAHPSTLGCWGDDDSSALVCRQVLDVTHDVKTFVFASTAKHLFHYDAGQFVTLRLQIDGAPVDRSYSLSSAPTRPHLIAITVKRVPGGLVSNWLHDTVAPGTQIEATGPLGAFTLSTTLAPKYLFLSAGSGITPLVSMTRTLHDLAARTDVLLVNSARTPADLLFGDELALMAATGTDLRVVDLCSRVPADHAWPGRRERLSAQVLSEVAPDLHERLVFACGPTGYRSQVRSLLVAMGFDMTRYREETYSFEDLAVIDLQDPPAPEAFVDLTGPGDDEAAGQGAAATATFTVEFARSGRTITCAADENVLDAALAAGLSLPSSCGQGLCGTCKTTALSGTVDMTHQGGIRPREIAQNKVLLCCSTPRSDLVIDS